MKIIKLKNLKNSDRIKLLKRSLIDAETVLNTVNDIINKVHVNGDQSINYYSKKFDNIELNDFKVKKEEFEDSINQVNLKLVKALENAADNIEKFHKAQMPNEWICNIDEGITAGQIVRPLKTVGCYIPGGRAVYPSTILMTVIPAKIAGVSKVICCTPPGENGYVKNEVLAAASIAGVDEVYKVGGAQAIAAMAYGTETIPKVDKIVGPGNIFVATAKKLVYGDVDIDFPAGPSEVIIIADDSANPEYIALDMLAQAEHDPNAAAVLVTTSESLAESVSNIINDKLSVSIPRLAIIKESLDNYGRIILTDTLKEAAEFSNEYAPEHLQIMTSQPETVLDDITNAGSIFLGELTPVAAGDYGSGTNHVLPTSGCARIYSGLSTASFLKKPTIQRLTPAGLKNLEETVTTIAEYEGLYLHAESFKKRLRN